MTDRVADLLLPAPRAAAWGLAAGAAAALLGPVAVVLVALAGAGGALLVSDVAARRAGLVAAVALAAGAGVGEARLARLAADPLGPALGRVAGARVVLLEEPAGATGRRRAAAAVTLRDGRRGTALLRLDDVRADRGEVLRVDGLLSRPRRGAGGFDERAWLARRGIHVALRVARVERLGRRGGLPGLLDRAHRAIARTVAPRGGDPGALVAGLAAGADEGLSPGAADAMRRSGLAHLLAVSGGNVALVVGLVLVATWAVGGSRRHARLVAVPAVVAYAGVVGTSPSVVRAAVAGGLACAAWLASRRADPWHLMGVGLAGLLCWNPASLADPGLQLSFAAVAALLLLAPVLARRLAGTGWCPRLAAPAVAASAACTVATAPISLVHFGAASLVASVPANLLALPLAAVIATLGLVAPLLAPVAPAAGSGCAGVARGAARLLLGVARIGARLDTAAGARASLLVPLAALLLAVVALRLARRGERP